MQKGYSFYGELLSRKRKDVDTLRRERVEKTWRAKTNLPLDSGQKIIGQDSGQTKRPLG